jgi:hypothetical protein
LKVKLSSKTTTFFPDGKVNVRQCNHVKKGKNRLSAGGFNAKADFPAILKRNFVEFGFIRLEIPEKAETQRSLVGLNKRKMP